MRNLRHQNLKFISNKVNFIVFLLVFYNISIFANDQEIKNSSISLNSFMQDVLEKNPSIQAAKANLAAAKSREIAASQPLYNPEISAETQQKKQYNFNDSELNGTPKPYEKTYVMGINQTIDIANKRQARLKVAATNREVAEAQFETLCQQFEIDILSALVRYHTAQKALTFSNKRVSLLRKFVNLTEKRQVAGDVPRVETDLAHLALSEGLAQQVAAEINLNQALQVLRSKTGMNHFTWPSLPQNLPNPNITNTSIEELLNHIPSLQVLNEQIVNAKMRIGLAKKERFPDPTFGFQGGKENTNEGDKKVFLATFSIPLFIRNSYRAEVDAAVFDEIEIEKKRMDALREIKAEIQSSAGRYQMLHQAINDWQQISQKPLSDGIVLIEKLWQAGEITTVDYLVQLKQRLDSQIAGIELNSQAWLAWVDWLKASGTVRKWTQINCT